MNSSPLCVEKLTLSDLRSVDFNPFQGEWKLTSPVTKDVFQVTLQAVAPVYDSIFSSEQAYALETPFWTLILTNFHALCEHLLGGSATHPDPEITQHLLISLSLELARRINVTSCTVRSLSSTESEYAQWKRELLTVGKNRKISFFSGHLFKQNFVVCTFTGVLISQTAAVNFIPGFRAEHFCFERVPSLLSSDFFRAADQNIFLPLSLSLTIGYVDCLDLSSKECESMLSAGSLLAVINTHLNSEACWVGGYGSTKININLAAGQKMGIIKMEDCEEHPVIGISGIEQKVRVSLGDIHLTYGELMALRQGQTLQIAGLPFPYVKLYSADRCIATGELVNCNDQLYVQIAGLTSEGSSENL